MAGRLSEVFYGLWNVINFDYGLLSSHNISHQEARYIRIRNGVTTYATIFDFDSNSCFFSLTPLRLRKNRR